MDRNVCPGTKPLLSKEHLRLRASTALLGIRCGSGSSLGLHYNAATGGDFENKSKFGEVFVSTAFCVCRSKTKR